jgi:hypothetical protein
LCPMIATAVVIKRKSPARVGASLELLPSGRNVT